MRLVWLSLSLLLTFIHLSWGVVRFQLERQKYEARSSVGRLGVLSAVFSGSEAGFWSSIGRSNALLDPWGNPYRWDRGPPSLWRSAGPDGQYYTEDDLWALVRAPEIEAAPLPEGLNSLSGR